MFISKQEVQYYVTDRMGITHYSIMFDGWNRLELFSEEGIISPVISMRTLDFESSESAISATPAKYNWVSWFRANAFVLI